MKGELRIDLLDQILKEGYGDSEAIQIHLLFLKTIMFSLYYQMLNDPMKNKLVCSNYNCQQNTWIAIGFSLKKQ